MINSVHSSTQGLLIPLHTPIALSLSPTTTEDTSKKNGFIIIEVVENECFHLLSFQQLVAWDQQPKCCTRIWHQCSPSSTTRHTVWQPNAGSASLYFVPQSRALKNHVSQPTTHPVPISTRSRSWHCHLWQQSGPKLNYMCTLTRFFMVFTCMLQIYIAFFFCY